MSFYQEADSCSLCAGLLGGINTFNISSQSIFEIYKKYIFLACMYVDEKISILLILAGYQIINY